MLKDYFKFNIQGKTIEPDQTIGEAVYLMKTKGLNCLLVQSEGGRAVGVLSEHDIITAYAKLDASAKSAKVQDFMTVDIVASFETDTVDEAVKTMAESNIRHLPILNQYGNVLDFLSIMDVVLCKTRKKIGVC